MRIDSALFQPLKACRGLDQFTVQTELHTCLAGGTRVADWLFGRSHVTLDGALLAWIVIGCWQSLPNSSLNHGRGGDVTTLALKESPLPPLDLFLQAWTSHPSEHLALPLFANQHYSISGLPESCSGFHLNDSVASASERFINPLGRYPRPGTSTTPQTVQITVIESSISKELDRDL